MDKDNVFLWIKAAVAGLCGAFTAAFGWMGWLVVAWVVCMAIDWISGSDAGVQTQPADKPGTGTGTTLAIGPVSSGDWGTIRSKCQDLQLMSLYREAEAGGMHTITVGPLSAGDVATLKALCEQLQLVEMGLYKEG